MKSKLKGVTLIETMLYIGLFSIILLIVLSFMMSTQESTLRNNRRGTVYKTSEFVKQHLEYSFKNALLIDNTNSLFNDNSGVLLLGFADGNKQYTLSDSSILFDTIPITPPDVTITKFFLEPIYNGDPNKPIAVRIGIELVSKEDPNITDSINILETLR
jgi:hypothetical protein